MKYKIYKGGVDNYPLWWYGQSNRLQNFGDRTNFLVPHGAVFQGNGYYFNSSNNDYLEDIYGRHLIHEGTNGLWSQLYLTDSAVPPCGSAVGTGDALYLQRDTIPLITGKIVLYPECCPNLDYLYCGHNLISILDVSMMASLTYLYCPDNQILKLDVSKLTLLEYLICSSNQISILDVATLVNLYNLTCSYNNITTLSLNNLVEITHLYCYNNYLTTLDVSNNSLILYLDCHNNLMDQSAVDKVLCDADNWGTSDGTLDISGNAAPSSTGTDCKNNLVNRNWTVTTD